MPKSTKEKGSDAEKYIASFLKSRGYACDIHPRTSTYTGTFWISRENDFYSVGDIIGLGSKDAILAQVTDTKETDNPTLTVPDGSVSARRNKIDVKFPENFPYLKFIVFLTQRRWVKPVKGQRHKEYFHRAWVREQTDSGPVWVEREEWSFFPDNNQDVLEV